MVLFIILGVIVVSTFIVLGVLSFMLSKEKQTEDEAQKKRAKQFEEQLRAVGLKAEEQSRETKRLIESTNAKVSLLEEELSRANATVAELNREKEALLSAPKPPVDQALHQELETLKYELVKARAQSSGLERASFNYKNQLEDFLNKLNAARSENDQLSQDKNRLETMVQEIKVQNEQLLKKDQLAQFELDKNRSRLASLERECEDLKARSGQKEGQG